jgi:hypothetical protein
MPSDEDVILLKNPLKCSFAGNEKECTLTVAVMV